MASTLKKDTGVIISLSFVVLFIVNALVISLSQAVFPTAVVLGTISIPHIWAVLHSAGTLAAFGTLAIPFFHLYEEKRGRMLSSTEWMVGYFVLNFAGVWLISRAAEQFGLGVSSVMVVVLLAAVLDVLQGAAMMWLESVRTQLDI